MSLDTTEARKRAANILREEAKRLRDWQPTPVESNDDVSPELARRVNVTANALHGFNVAVLEEVGGAHALVYIPVRHHEFAEELERRGVSLTPVKRGVTGVEPAEPDDAWLMGWVLAEESHAGLSE